MNQPSNFTFIDLFAGIGGFRLALDSLGGNCVYSSDIDLECQKTYFENFGDYPAGDITQIDPDSIPNHDILCAGFPCQPFSISGLKKGFEDTRGTLFFNILKIIQAKRPRVVFLENVKNLVVHDSGNTLSTIIRHLEEQNYLVSYKVLNAKNFGLAQNRERIIIVATQNQKFDFNKIPTQPALTIAEILDASGEFTYLKDDEFTIINQRLWKTQESGLIFCGYRNKSIRKTGTRENTEHLSRVHKQPNRIYHINGTHPTLPSQETSGRFWIYDGLKVRKLTIQECFKLQGFPSTYKTVSSTGNIYRQIGNSVAIPMIKSVASEIVKRHLVDDIVINNRFDNLNLNFTHVDHNQIMVAETLF